MFAFLQLLGTFLASLFRPRRRLEVENLFLRHQLNIALRGAPHRLRLRGTDRALLVWMTWLWPSLLGLSRVVQPDTILRWHRAGFRAYWRWKSRSRPGRPRVSPELRDLIRRMSRENPLWGAPRIHGELLKLGFEIAESTVSKYMVRYRRPPSQTWRAFLHNHADAIDDYFVRAKMKKHADAPATILLRTLIASTRKERSVSRSRTQALRRRRRVWVC